jgi:hypothetical protein
VESLGSVELFATEQFIDGPDGSLSATLICRPANLEGVRIAIRFCKLRFARDPNPDEVQRKARPTAIAPLRNDEGEEVSVQRVGTSQRPTVEVKAARGAIELVNLPDDIWPISAANAGDRYQVQLVVYLRDCRLVEEGDDGELGLDHIPAEEGNSFIGPGPRKMELILSHIEARMAELKSLDFEDGYGVLHTFTVELVPVHPASGEGKADDSA